MRTDSILPLRPAAPAAPPPGARWRYLPPAPDGPVLGSRGLGRGRRGLVVAVGDDEERAPGAEEVAVGLAEGRVEEVVMGEWLDEHGLRVATAWRRLLAQLPGRRDEDPLSAAAGEPGGHRLSIVQGGRWW